MTQYASKTSVASNVTRDEIEKTLKRYGATSFAYGSSTDTAMVGFVADGRNIRFVLELPDSSAREFTHTPSTRALRSKAAAEAAYEQAIRQKWRALLLLVKAKLEAVESGIVSFESEFLAHIVLPDNGTVFEHVQPTIAAVYADGRVSPLLQLGRAA